MSFLKTLTSFFGQKEAGRTPVKKNKRKKKIKKNISPKLISQKDKIVAQQYIADAKAKAREIIIEAKDEAFKLKQEASIQVNKKNQELNILQQKIYKTQAEIEHKLGRLEEKDNQLEKNREDLNAKIADLKKVKKEQVIKLEKISNLTKEEAKRIILEAVEKKSKSEIGKIIKEAEEEATKNADEKAKEILVEAMKQGATDYVAEYTVSVVKIDDDDIKGRVIGREGRNIRTFEKVTGVDVDLDEEGVIRLSSFDSVRREIAKVTLERLIRDGRIQPAKIEEVYEKTVKDIERIMFKAGEDLCHRVKVYNLPRDVMQMLGRFKYRYSYGQNMITHTIEVVKIGVALAKEVGANPNIVRLGCLLHDIGKVITEEEGSHVDTGVNFVKKFGIPKQVVDAIAQHHEDVPFSSIESVLVYIADAISGARPGARYADLDGYVTRMKELESAALDFEGVTKAYAIQAGREVRVIVDPKSTDDDSTYKLASDIRDKIKNELTYPGTVKVTVIRELRASEVAN